MKIGIDARLINETGVGRYIRNLITELSRIDTTNQYVAFLPGSAYEAFVLPNKKWEKRRCDIHWHTVKEQLLMPGIFLREHLDLLHVPYFNAPIFYPKPYVLTIHDLTILHVTTGKATTLPKPLYWLRRLGYQLILRIGIKKACHIIAVSKATKQDIIKSIGISEEKISVTYEGVDTRISRIQSKKPIIGNPYFLYVGNAYPHKNLEFHIKSFGVFLEKDSQKKHQLVLVGKDDFFYKRLKVWVSTLPYKNNIHFFGPADDQQLSSLYVNAISFVFPSLMEGFGLPALEAIVCGSPVICSDIPVFHELFGSIPTYVNPHDQSSLVNAFEDTVIQTKTPLTEEEKKKIASYRWDTTAKETLHIYEGLSL
ncbi:MAG: glycosyltransferase family 1 protein [Candidatus Gottesmanbacteria bacterium]